MRLSRPGLGDLVQRNTFLHLLRRALPGAEIALVVGAAEAERFAELLGRHMLADRVIACPGHDAPPAAVERFTREQLAAERFELCLVDPDSAGLGPSHAALAGIPERVGVPRGEPGDAHLTRLVRLSRPMLGRHDLYDHAVGLAQALGQPRPRAGELPPDLPRSSDATPRAASAAPPLVALHAGGARHWNRRWPLARYEQLATRAIDELAAEVALIGEAGECDETDGLAEALRRRRPGAAVHSARGESIDATAGLIARADVLVGNESGPAHLAAAVGTPSVVVYGPTGTRYLWARLYRHQRAVSLDYDCQRILGVPPGTATMPCEHRCPYRYAGPGGPYPACLEAIGVDMVWDALVAQLRPAPPAVAVSS